MIRVCAVAPKYMTGGQAIEARTLVDGFARDPHVRVELQPIDPRIPEWIARVRGVRTLARMPLFWWGMFRRFRRADVVHVFTAGFGPFLLTTTPAVLLGRMMGKPVILNYRDGRAADHIGRKWVGWVLRRASRLVFPSGFLRDLFSRFGFEGEVVYNVVDTDRFRFRPRQPLRPVLLSCRLLEELYAVENSIAAFELVKREWPDARLIVIGDGDRRPGLEAMVSDRGIEGVEFHGAVPHADVPAWFERADILVNSSRIDNMPHSLIEAFAAGVPVVTTPSGGIPYVVQDERNGLFANVDDPGSMAAAVLRLLEEPGLARRLVEQGTRDCERRYAWGAARRAWKAIYRELAGVQVKGAPETAVAETSAMAGPPR